jgi:hypothetical protein
MASEPNAAQSVAPRKKPEFSWSNRDCVLIESVDSIAVYTDGDGKIVIRQQDIDGHASDQMIVIPRARVAELVRALQQECESSDDRFVS